MVNWSSENYGSSEVIKICHINEHLIRFFKNTSFTTQPMKSLKFFVPKVHNKSVYHFNLILANIY